MELQPGCSGFDSRLIGMWNREEHTESESEMCAVFLSVCRLRWASVKDQRTTGRFVVMTHSESSPRSFNNNTVARSDSLGLGAEKKGQQIVLWTIIDRRCVAGRLHKPSKKASRKFTDFGEI